MTVGVPIRGRPGTAQPEDSQSPGNHANAAPQRRRGVPSDNPFVGKPGYRPEIYALGIRQYPGLVIHPDTGEIWENENGPMGGDEINIIKPGRNYGWPVVSAGRAYNGDPIGDTSGPLTTRSRRPAWIAVPVLGAVDRPFGLDVLYRTIRAVEGTSSLAACGDPASASS
jgi:glucose/arabinose dehydrogenase